MKSLFLTKPKLWYNFPFMFSSHAASVLLFWGGKGIRASCNWKTSSWIQFAEDWQILLVPLCQCLQSEHWAIGESHAKKHKTKATQIQIQPFKMDWPGGVYSIYVLFKLYLVFKAPVMGKRSFVPKKNSITLGILASPACFIFCCTINSYHLDTKSTIWMFPKIGVSPNHPF